MGIKKTITQALQAEFGWWAVFRHLKLEFQNKNGRRQYLVRIKGEDIGVRVWLSLKGDHARVTRAISPVAQFATDWSTDMALVGRWTASMVRDQLTAKGSKKLSSFKVSLGQTQGRG